MPASLEEEVFDLVGYMITSARNLLDETPLYGPFRLVDAVSRLVGILEGEGKASPRLLALQKRVEAGKYSVMRDQDEFHNYLEGLVNALVDEMTPEQRG
jgi:hypothetical protein